MTPARDRIAEFFREETPRRALGLLLFFGLLATFRSLLLLVVFFVAFRKLLGLGADLLHQRLKVQHKVAVALVTVLILAIVGLGLALGVGRLIEAAQLARTEIPERLADLRRYPIYQSLEARLEGFGERLLSGAERYTSDALHILSSFGRGILFALIGFVLALVSLLEREELRHFHGRVSPATIEGTLLRWLGYLGEALWVMVQFQLVVALVNALLTLPVLLILGLPHIPSLFLLIFVSALVPVVGNFVSGGVLTLLAYQLHGWTGVGLFIGLTFILHKIESYYLNPRLAARHIQLPSFVLICSLILFEHLFGFVGLFLSFPGLFLAQRIRSEWAATHTATHPHIAADTTAPAATSTPEHSAAAAHAPATPPPRSGAPDEQPPSSEPRADSV
jgi:predicted PurR-regulated permease PerM